MPKSCCRTEGPRRGRRVLSVSAGWPAIAVSAVVRAAVAGFGCGGVAAAAAALTGPEGSPPCPLECPPGSISEGEPCDDGTTPDTTNAGCNAPDEFMATEVACGDTLCGVAWAVGGTRDTDQIAVAAGIDESIRIMTVVAEFNVLVAAWSSTDCSEDFPVAASGPGCEPISIQASLPIPGGQDAWFFVAYADFDGLPCNGALIGRDYIATFACAAVPPTPCPSLGDTDADGDVDFQDLLTVLANFGACP